jgi:kynureninase
MTEWSTEPALAASLDAADEFAAFRARFELPPPPEGATDSIYFVGNSLGPMPTKAREYINFELDRWARLGVKGHFDGDPGWADYHKILIDPLCRMVGALPHEVAVMNTLTVNLHNLLISFYRPTAERHKILIEEHAFPSDHFAVESQIRLHGFDPADSLVTIKPRDGGELFHVEDIVAAIAEHGDSLATVLLPGVQYYTGQVMPINAIVQAGHAAGATVGIDLAHSVGNVALTLHESNVDFATWCSYKYVNSSPGGISGIYVHERHVNDQSLPKLIGWWGNRMETRFAMENSFDPYPTAESWAASNVTALPMAALRASLEIFDDAGGVVALRSKSQKQTAYLLYLLDELLGGDVQSLTPRDPEQRGCQLSLEIVPDDIDGRAVFEAIEAAGVFCDWRFPNVIRVAPTPLFNTFSEIRRFVDLLAGAIAANRTL